MRFARVALFIMILFLPAASLARTPAQNPSTASPSVAIQQVLENQVAAWNRGNLEEFMQGYWNSPDLVFTSGGNVRRGWQATLDQYKKNYSNRELMGTLSFSDLEIHLWGEPPGGDARQVNAAWVLGRWRLQREKDEPHGIFTLIFRKFPPAKGLHTPVWKIVHDHTSLAP